MAEKLFDFHSHILPGMDDGCKTVQEAVTALKQSYAQGVRGVCLTPHFYADESMEEFLARRQAAQEKLKQAMDTDAGPFPGLCLGAEVAYYPDMSRTEHIEKLCVGSSRLLLVELPFSRWESEVYLDLHNLCASGITPILAHIDRYWSIQSSAMLRQVLSLDLLAQINGEALLDWKRRGKAKKWLQSNFAQLLGSDCHNLSTRAPNLGTAVKSLPNETLTMLSAFQTQVWENMTGK